MKKFTLLLAIIVGMLNINAQTIQDLIDNSNVGDTVFVTSGTYTLTETIQLDKQIILECESLGSCLVDASNVIGAFDITGYGAWLSGFTIQGGANTSYGISVYHPNSVFDGVTYTVIAGNEIYGMELSNPGNSSPLSYGILVYGSSATQPTSGVTMMNNSIHNIDGSGISLGTYSAMISITDNDIADINSVQVLGEDFSVGINAQFAGYVDISNNTFTNLLIGSNILGAQFTTISQADFQYYNVPCIHLETAATPVMMSFSGSLWSVNSSVDDGNGTVYDIISYYNDVNIALLASMAAGSPVLDQNGDQVGCDGVANSGLVYDDCGVCDGDNSSCAGCDGVANSGLVNDDCGVCNGDNSSCTGCMDANAENYDSSATIDSGYCTIIVCEEVSASAYSGPEVVNFVKQNGADWTLPENRDIITATCEITRQDDNALYNYVTQSDFGDNQSNSNIEWKYGGYNSTNTWYDNLKDAAGWDMESVPGETFTMHILDDDLYFEIAFTSWTCCGFYDYENEGAGGFAYTRTFINTGNASGAATQDCNEVPLVYGCTDDTACNYDATANFDDACDYISCAGCDGVSNSGLVNDDCGVCDGDNSSCAGCDGVANSGLVNDDCGVCDGDGPASGADCNGDCLEGYQALTLTWTGAGGGAGSGSGNGTGGGTGTGLTTITVTGDVNGELYSNTLTNDGSITECWLLDLAEDCFTIDIAGPNSLTWELGTGGIVILQGTNENILFGETCIQGCMDSTACNFSQDAQIDDESCDYTTCLDDCGVVNGDNSTCADCCGVPNGDGTTCDGLCGPCNDYTTCLDDCGIPGGDNSTCADCAGVPNGDSELDACGVCDNDSTNDDTTCLDCAGVPNGDSELDTCGVCDNDSTNDNTTCLDCAGVPNGGAILDDCGVCNGDNSTCVDCCGVPNGDGTTCDGACGICNDDLSCLDCSGVPNGGAILDDCGVCDGDDTNNNSTCEQDCSGVWAGDATEDECGVCDNDSTNDCEQDCTGVWGGDSIVDECGECNGPGPDEGYDCEGNCAEGYTLLTLEWDGAFDDVFTGAIFSVTGEINGLLYTDSLLTNSGSISSCWMTDLQQDCFTIDILGGDNLTWTITSDSFGNQGSVEFLSGTSENIEFGSLCDNTSINEIINSKKLLIIVDILGKEVTQPNKDALLFYIYDDGSVEKKYQLK